MSWVTIEDLKLDLGTQYEDGRDDEVLSAVLDAAIAYVERVRGDDFDFDDESSSELPAPSADLKLGTVRLARRWYERRRTPDGVVSMGELGVGRVPSIDPDIERLLSIGRFRGPVFA